MLLRCLRADFQKVRRLGPGAAHLIIPPGVAAIFLLYYVYTPWKAESKIEAYYQVLAMGFPILIGVFCAQLAGQESSAGAFQNMLSVQRRVAVFFSKLLLLLLSGLGAVLLASGLFGAGFYFLLRERAVGGTCYFAAALVLFGSQLFLYVLHLFLAFAMNKGVTVGVGIVESLLSALLLTGMGEGVWPLVPAAWGGRLVTLLLRKYSFCAMIGADARLAACVCILATVGSMVAFGVWACRWEGVRGNE